MNEDAVVEKWNIKHQLFINIVMNVDVRVAASLTTHILRYSVSRYGKEGSIFAEWSVLRSRRRIFVDSIQPSLAEELSRDCVTLLDHRRRTHLPTPQIYAFEACNTDILNGLYPHLETVKCSASLLERAK